MEYAFLILIAMFIIVGPWIFILIQSSNIKNLTRRVDELQRYLYGPRPQPSSVNEVPSPQDFQQSSVNEVLSTEGSVNEVLSTEGSFNEVPSPEDFQQSSLNEVPSTKGSLNEVLSTKSEKRSSKEWELLIGGKLLNRIGAVAIVLGMLFFLKYAFDKNWITEPMRVGIGVLTGASLLVLAWRAHKKEMVVFAQGLIGAGLPVLYLSVWSTYSYYHLLPHTAAFLLMTVVTLVAVWHAVRYKSLFIGLMAVLGGMLTPALLRTDVVNTTGLFTYLALLDLGLFSMVVVWTKWRTIGWTTIVGTLIWWGLWDDALTSAQLIADFPAPIFFGLLFISMYAAYDILAHRIATGSQDLAQRFGMAFALFIQTMMIYNVLDHFAVVSWIVSFGLLTLIAVAAFVVVLRQSDASLAFRSMYATLIVVCSAMIPAHDDISNVEVALFRALIVAACVFALRPVGFVLPTLTGGAIAFFSLLNVFMQETAWQMDGEYLYALPWNGLPVALVACGFGLYVCGYVLNSSKRSELLFINRLLGVLGWSMLAATAAKLAYDFSYDRLAADSIAGVEWQNYVAGVSSLMAAAFVGFTLRLVGEFRNASKASIAGGLVQCVCVAVWLFVALPFAPDSHFTSGLNLRVASGAILLLMLYVTMRYSQRGVLLSTRAWKMTLWLCFGLLSFALASVEAIWPLTIDMQRAYDQSAPNVADDILDKIHLVLSSVWIVYASIVVAIGFYRRRGAVRITGISLLGISILKIFFYDLSYLEQPYRIVSFIVLGVILLGASFVYQRYKHIILT